MFIAQVTGFPEHTYSHLVELEYWQKIGMNKNIKYCYDPVILCWPLHDNQEV